MRQEADSIHIQPTAIAIDTVDNGPVVSQAEVRDTLRSDTIARSAMPETKTIVTEKIIVSDDAMINLELVAGPPALAQTDSLALATIGYTPDITKAREIIYTPIDEEEEVVETCAPADWRTGIEGEPRPIYVGDNSGVLAIVAGIFLLMMLSYRHCRRLFTTMAQELWGMRHRPNVFDEHTTNENRMLALMALQWSICTGLLLYSGLSLSGFALLPANAFEDSAKLIGLMACYYGAQLCWYNVVGYTFANNDGRRLWVKGFTASQSFLGFSLIIPALVAIFYPIAAEIAVIVGVFLYFVARIVFIAKGFRIFYKDFGSLFYFILYLCTLEIIPLIFVYEIAILLVNSL